MILLMSNGAHQAPLSTGFSRQEYWSGLPLPSSGDLLDPGIDLTPPALAGRFFTSESPGTPILLSTSLILTTLVLLPGKSRGRRSLVGCSPWGCYESVTTERLHFHFQVPHISEIKDLYFCGLVHLTWYNILKVHPCLAYA